MDNFTFDFYLYGVLEKITAVLDVLNVGYTVTETPDRVINCKQLTVPKNADIIATIDTINSYLEKH